MKDYVSRGSCVPGVNGDDDASGYYDAVAGEEVAVELFLRKNVLLRHRADGVGDDIRNSCQTGLVEVVVVHHHLTM